MKTIAEHITNPVDDVDENTLTHVITYNRDYLWWSPIGLAGGFIFKDVKIMRRSEIVSASLTFRHTRWNAGFGITLILVIEGWKTTGILNWQFPPLIQTPSGCPKTTASASLNYTGAVPFIPGACQWSKVVNVTSIVQELVNQTGWMKGHDIGFALYRGSVFGRRDFVEMCMRDKSEADSVKLSVVIKPKVILNPLNRYEGVIY